ncbi:MAG: ATP-dependent DNA helicase RecG [Alphaproteobacteria bacterium]|jgi:ATP-dependent DNA helicase RecG
MTIKQNFLFDNFDKLPRVPEKLVPRFRKLCGLRYIDLLLHMPVAIQKRSYRKTCDDCIDDEISVLIVTVLSHKTGKSRRMPYKIYVADDAGDRLELVFFNSGAWLKTAYPVGSEVTISGTIVRTLSGAQMHHPDSWGKSKTLDEICGVSPVYPLTAGVSNKVLSNTIQAVLKMAMQQPFNEWLPDELLERYNWPRFMAALKAIHFPENEDIINPLCPSRCRLAFDELYAWQLALIKARNENSHLDGVEHDLRKGDLRTQFYKNLPFTLTGDQSRTVQEIDHDMALPTPMLRLAQGDVGSGKTVVAFAALLTAIENGNQGAMMAPTEILAIQHYENAKQWLEPLGVRLGLLTGKLKAKEKREIKAQISAGEIDLLIGTHALIEDDVLLPSCSLVVIDEQHRFGVKQRLALTKNRAPDLLVMTATPIPRTLALTFYGDMDISVIREKPPGRTEIDTRVFSTEKLATITQSLQRIFDRGEQVYWVCPLVEESEKSDLAAATVRHEYLQKTYGDDVALLHGKMKGKEKEQVLNDFKNKKFKVLVSTTVIEVGVDIPNATTMVIEHAERFGLSQLHQLRGRVGRGSKQSTCLLVYAPPLGVFSRERLDVMRSTGDGFIIAEKDLKLRGPGEALGTAQAGRLFTRLADLAEHSDIIPEARDLAHTHKEIDVFCKTPDIEILFQIFKKAEATEMMNAG